MSTPGTGGVSSGALDGLVVLDLTQMLAGPYAAMMLADHGARVIKIEPPGGDGTRRMGPHLEGATPMEQGGYGAYFASINRNKESLCLDLKSEQAKDLLRTMVRQADVVMENYRSGVMERLGLGYESLQAINPKLVYATLRGFGDPRTGESPYAKWPAYDPVAQAMGGIMGITGGQVGGPPTKVGPGIGDIGPAMFLAFGIASACWRAERTGQGQFVDVGMVDCVLAICERMVFQYGVTGKSPGPEGNGHPLLCPFGLFPAKDGYVSIGVPRDEFWVLLADKMGQPNLATDPRYETNDSRITRRSEVDTMVSDWTSARTKQEISEVLGSVVPYGPVFNAEDIFGDAHFVARDMLKKMAQPGTHLQNTIANTPVHMSISPGGVKRRAPLIGEDNRRVLTDFGFSPEQVAAYIGSGAVQ